MKIRVVLVGLGHIGQRHAKIIQSLEAFELVATVDPVNLGLGSIPHFKSLEDFMESGVSADLVSIATPNHLHAPLANRTEEWFSCCCRKTVGYSRRRSKRIDRVEESIGKTSFFGHAKPIQPHCSMVKICS